MNLKINNSLISVYEIREVFLQNFFLFADLPKKFFFFLKTLKKIFFFDKKSLDEEAITFGSLHQILNAGFANSRLILANVHLLVHILDSFP